jgi:hypothetical protein
MEHSTTYPVDALRSGGVSQDASGQGGLGNMEDRPRLRLRGTVAPLRE